MKTYHLCIILLLYFFCSEINLLASDNSEINLTTNSFYKNFDFDETFRDLKTEFYNGKNYFFIRYTSPGKENKITFFTENSNPGHIVISERLEGHVRYITTCVFKGKLYLFYVMDTPGRDKNKIYYKAFFPNESGDIEWNNTEEHVIDIGLSSEVILGTAKVANDRLVLFYATQDNGGYSWGTTSFDGNSNNTWDENINNLFGAPGIPQDATVFPVTITNKNGSTNIEQRMMIVYTANNGNTFYVFYNPATKTVYDNQMFPYEGHEIKSNSIRLATGTIKGCDFYNKEAIQVWTTGYNKHDDYYYIWHAQYIPDGPEGNKGHWLENNGKRWAQYQNNEHKVYKKPGLFSTHVIVDTETETKENKNGDQDTIVKNAQQKIAICHYKSTNRFNINTILSDKLKKVSEEKDVSTENSQAAWTLLGVIEGVPPYSDNGHPELRFRDAPMIRYGEKRFQEMSTTSKYETELAAGYKHSFSGGKTTIGLNFTNTLINSIKKTETHLDITQYTFYDDDSANGADRGWMIFLVPSINNIEYKTYAYDGTDLGYSYNLITVNKLNLKTETYKLTDPTDNTLKLPLTFDNMQTRNPSNRYLSWKNLDFPGDPTYSNMIKLNTMDGGTGTETYLYFEDSGSINYSNSMSNKIKISGGYCGFSSEASGSFELNQEVQTSVSKYIGLIYKLPAPPPEGEGYIKHITVQPYLLKPLTDKAWWIPNEFNGNRPWCITYSITNITPYTKQELKKLFSNKNTSDVYTPINVNI